MKHNPAAVNVALALLVVGCGRHVQVAAPSAIFIGLTNNPVPQMQPTRVNVADGVTGTCALFWFTNPPANPHIWFKTASIEQQTPTGWQPYIPISAGHWLGIEGFKWQPGYGCFMAVAWPPGLPTNSTWRLQLEYGENESGDPAALNGKTSWQKFIAGPHDNIISSAAVSP